MTKDSDAKIADLERRLDEVAQGSSALAKLIDQLAEEVQAILAPPSDSDLANGGLDLILLAPLDDDE